jgi:ankyrin repeat protein
LCVAVVAAPALAQAQQGSLADLIQAGNRKAALEQIRAGADVNQAQPDGARPVHWAVYRVDYELLEALLARKAEVNVKNAFGSTPIAEAAKVAEARMMRMLLDAGAEPEGANDDGQTALMLAIQTGELPVVELLINAGANVNTIEKFHDQTPLMWAAAAPRNAGEMVKRLLAKGADFKPRAQFTDWPSQITSEPRAQYRPTGGLTALLYAARDGCYRCVEALLDAGDDVNRPTPEGVTPLMLALDNDHQEVAKLLLDRGASPHVWDWWGRTALYLVIDRKAVAEVGAADVFGNVRRSAPPAPPPPGVTAVSRMEIINALLDAGVDSNPQLNMHRPSRNGNSGRFIDPLLNTGCTPLLRATMARDVDVMRALLAKGANPNINAMGVTSFLVAAGVGPGNRGGTGLAAQTSEGGNADRDLMNLLLEHGADVDAQVTGTLTYSKRIGRAPSANEGMTALHVAAQRGRLDMVLYLIEHGADPAILDSNARKPFDLVSEARPDAALLSDSAAAAVRTGSDPASIEKIRELLGGRAAGR